MPIPSVVVRGCTEADWPAVVWVDQLAFTYTFEGHAEVQSERDVFEIDRSLLATVDGVPVGHASAYSLEMSVPGGLSLPVGGCTWVGVVPTARRRGVLTALMAEQLQQFHDRGEAVAALFASEPGIYRRYGYGLASSAYSVSVARGDGRLDPLPDPSLRAEILAVPDARVHVDRVYDGVRRARAGLIACNDAWWRRRTNDPPDHRAGLSELRTLVVSGDEGARAYAMFAASQDWTGGSADGRMTVREALALDPAADTLLWQTLFDVDLIGAVTARGIPVDATLLDRLVDPRRARPTLRDGLYVRLVDVPAALVARGYEQAWHGVVEVSDAQRAENAGRWQLHLGPDDADVVRTDAEPDLVVDVAELGGAFLGGTSLSRRGAAGYVEERTPGALRGLSAALQHNPAPFGPVHF